MSARVTAARSSPFSPITTSRPSRVSAALHGRSYWCVTRGPTACTSRRSGLLATAAKPFDAQHVEALGQRGNARDQRGRVGDFAERHDERIEIVVVVLRFGIVPGAAVVDVVLGADAEPEQQRLVDLAVGDGDDLHAARQRAGNRRQRLVDAGFVEQVALVEHDEIGAGDLILENFFDRIVVIERGIGGALPLQRVEIVRDAAIGERRAVDHDHDAVDGDAALDRRPMERLHQRFRQSEAGGFDHDVLDAALGENGVERRHEFVGDRAAQAAVGEFDDVLLRAGGVAAAFEDFAVDADVAELVDDDGEAAALRVGEHVADQRRLAGAEKAGDDGAGNARERAGSCRVNLFEIEGRNAGDQAALEDFRPAAPRQDAVGGAGEEARAFDQRAGAFAASSPPNT